MKCISCKKKMVKRKGIYHYKESGLDNVYLKTSIYKCNGCKKTLPRISKIYALHSLIAQLIVKKPSLLNGSEIRYIRKQMHLTGIEFAEILGKTRNTVSRWENNKEPISESSDKLIRYTYTQTCEEKSKKVVRILDSIKAIKPIKKLQKIVIPEEDIKTSDCQL